MKFNAFHTPGNEARCPVNIGFRDSSQFSVKPFHAT